MGKLADFKKGYTPKVDTIKDIQSLNTPRKAKTKARSYLDTPINLNQPDQDQDQSSLLEKISKLEKENLHLKQVQRKRSLAKRKTPLSVENNVSKFIKAIKQESVIQNTNWPILSTNKIRKTYKITANSFKKCLLFGKENRLFTRKKISFAGNVITYSYNIPETTKQ